MVALQIISKCLQVGNIDIIENNGLTEEYFTGYEQELNFILKHYKEYGNTPDKATFLSTFPDIELVDVAESDKYLVDTIREEHLYYQSAPILNRYNELLQTDANVAAEYMIKAIKELQPHYKLGGIDIIADAKQRYDEFVERKQNQKEWFFTTGLPELDELIHGIQRREELFVIFARTNQGKSWLLEKICSHIWEIGFNIGYISPEMGASSIGYRFDTLYKNFSNNGLMWGNNTVEEEEYKQYIEELISSHKNKFMVATPNDFDRKITITKLRNWIRENGLDLIAIDGITYLSDERAERRDNKTTSLTNISEDLMSLSMEVGVPVLAVVQANRGGVTDKGNDDLPELENIRDSDGISYNASKVISLKQKDDALLLQVKKHRNGLVGGKVAYIWNANVGEFIPTNLNNDEPIKRRERTKKKQQSDEDVF